GLVLFHLLLGGGGGGRFDVLRWYCPFFLSPWLDRQFLLGALVNRRFDRAYAGTTRRNSQAERNPVLIDCRTFSLAASAAAIAACLAAAPAAAKDTGLIFVSNEKSNNLIVIDPKTYKVIKDIKTSRRPRDMHFSADR